MNRAGELRDATGFLIAYNANGRGKLEGPWMDMWGNPIGHINEEGTWDTNFNRLSTQKVPGLLAQFVQREPGTTLPGIGSSGTHSTQHPDVSLSQNNAHFEDPFDTGSDHSPGGQGSDPFADRQDRSSDPLDDLDI